MGNTPPDTKGTTSADRLGSGDLAALIIDALLCANIVKKEHVDWAVRIATEEIEARKSLGDY